MAKISSYSPGSFCWAELASTDTVAAKHFYTGMFGWTFPDLPIRVQPNRACPRTGMPTSPSQTRMRPRPKLPHSAAR